jgi:hypothetical protein
MKKIIKKNPQRQINQEDLVKIRKFFHKKMNLGICPVMGIPFDEKDMVVDHVHPSNAKNLSREFESGLIRGVINRHANSMEGKITNSYIRYGLHKSGVSLHTFLRNLADFIENPPMTNLQYLHPREKSKTKQLSVNSVKKLNRLNQRLNPGAKIIEYPKSQKMTKKLEGLYNELCLIPEFRKNNIKKKRKKKK